MNYSQKIQNKAETIQHLSDAFYEVRATLDILTVLDVNGGGSLTGESIQKVVFNALEWVDAIEAKINQDCAKEEVQS